MADVTAHVVYYDDRKAGLVADCLAPVATEAAARTGGVVFLERHWRFGPHVRVCATGGEDAAGWFREAARPRIEDYLRRVPSRAPLDRTAYLRRSAELGTAELVRPPYGPIWPDNTVVLTPYQRRTDLHGEAGAEVKERFLAACVEPVAALLAATRDAPAARLAHVLRLFALVATAYDGDPGAGALSYRSHVEDFLWHADPAGTVRAAFDARYAAVRDQVVADVRAVLADSDRARYAGADPVLRAWSGVLCGVGPSIGALVARNEIDEDPSSRYYDVAREVSDDARKRWDFARRRSFGDFHTTLRTLDFRPRQNVPAFAAYRWLVNLWYLVLPLLDVSPVERCFVGHAVASALDEISGVTWRERLDALGAGGIPGRPF
jgi:hypothetical protein